MARVEAAEANAPQSKKKLLSGTTNSKTKHFVFGGAQKHYALHNVPLIQPLDEPRSFHTFYRCGFLVLRGV